jgi:adenine-specific DNA-methyltransferase
MRERLEILYKLLTDDGSIYVNIDFNECHYLKILMDEIFGRECFQREIVWRIGWLSGFKTAANNYIRNHDTILYYTKKEKGFYFNKENAYNSFDDFQERFNEASKKEILHRLKDLGVENNDAKEFCDFVSKVGLPERYPLEDTWNCSVYDKLNSIAVVSFSGEKVSKMLGEPEFKGQKSEALIRRILSISTQPGDIVFDSFLGTGTTAAVAHKMGRRWIGIELGNHAYTLCKPRLEKVINGEDNSGITAKENWQGGGGFRFFELGESLIKKDCFGESIINKNFNAVMLAQAVCKLEGFTYSPSQDEYFIHGYGTEQDFIFVTTNFMTQEHLKSISEQLGEKRSLLICCRSFEETTQFNNLTVKKIPQAVLDKCEWGHDDYSLNVANLPMSASVLVQAELFDEHFK